MELPPRGDDAGDGVPDDRVPLFGSWPGAYAAVVITALLVMALVAVFSRWPF
jgi:hypothetical protein